MCRQSVRASPDLQTTETTLSTEEPLRKPTAKVDPNLVRETQVEIRGLVDEIARLSRSSMGRQEYLEAVLNRMVTALAAVGGAIWMRRDDGALELAQQVNFRQAFSDTSQGPLEQHAGVLNRVMTSGEGMLVGPDSSSDQDGAGNPSPFLLVLSPVKRDAESAGVIEIFQRPGAGPTTQRGYLRFVGEMSELVGVYLQNDHVRELERRQAAFAQLDDFSRNVHKTLDVKLTAYTIANEGRRLIGCDRLSVATVKGRCAEIVAVSGQETIERRADTIKRMRQLVETVVRTGQPLWYDGNHEDLAPQIESVVDAYVDLAHAKSVTVLPLREPAESGEEEIDSKKQKKEPPVIAALVIEQIEVPQDRAAIAERSDAVAQHSAAALANAMDHQGVFLLPLWKMLGKARWLVEAQRLPKTLTAAVVIVLAIAALFFVPADLALEGRGTLQPIERRDIFAPMPGKVKTVRVKHGDRVKAGDVLVELESFELDEQILELQNQLQSVEKQKSQKEVARARLDQSDERERHELGAEIEVLELQRTGLTRRLKGYDEQRERLNVTSPIDGIVVTWQVDERLEKRPVERGQVLLTVANPDSQWELEIHMPEDRMAHVSNAWIGRDKEGLKVSYILATAPGDEHEGTVRKVYESAEVRGEEGNGVLLRVDINEKDLSELRPGASVVAKIHCGDASLGYVWFGDVIHFVQSRILFRL